MGDFFATDHCLGGDCSTKLLRHYKPYNILVGGAGVTKRLHQINEGEGVSYDITTVRKNSEILIFRIHWITIGGEEEPQNKFCNC